ncbi:MAG: DUF308 domain-containing protein [Clostridia bacterium]|nr:DUF308 domain-containing protein [Clostridia bacterium]
MDKLKNALKKLKIQASVAAVALIIIGLMFIIFRDTSLNVICYVAGALIMVWGVLCLLTFFITGFVRGNAGDLALGLTLVLVALILFIKPWVITGIITVLFGIALIVDGAVKLQQFVAMNRAKIKSRWAVLAFAVILLVLGILIVFDPFGSSIMIFAGIALIFAGVLDLCALGLVKNLKDNAERNVIDLDDDDIKPEGTDEGE